MHRTSSASRCGVRGIALWGVRSIMSDAIEKVVGHYAANTFIESMAMNSRNIVRLTEQLSVLCGMEAHCHLSNNANRLSVRIDFNVY